jgi:hypothetical protein
MEVGQTLRSVIAIGAAKSGTTALFYALRNALRREGIETAGLFEPHNQEEVEEYLASGSDSVPLAKALLLWVAKWEPRTFLQFQKRIVICRDPRDNMISALTFKFPSRVRSGDKAKVEALINIFREKEAAPDKISVLEMLRRIRPLTDKDEDFSMPLRRNALFPADFRRRYGDQCFFLPYEDFVEGRLGALSDYVGIRIDPGAEIDARHSFVTRKRTARDWPNWFLEEDIDFFVREVQGDYRLLGFDPEERPLVRREIAPEHCSQYVRKMVDRIEEKRRTRKALRRAEGKGRTEA